MRPFDITLPDGRKLAIAEWGNPQGKPAFVFIGGQGRMTCHPDESIAQRVGLRLFTVDRPGNGASDWLPQRTLKSFATDIADAANQLDCHSFGVIGVSHGGATAATCAADLPERVMALGLVSSIAPPERDPPATPFMQRSVWMARRAPFLLTILHSTARLMFKINARWTVQQIINGFSETDRTVYQTMPKLVDDMIVGLKEDYRQGVRGVVREAQLGYLPWEIRRDAIQTPTIIWQGELDTTVLPDTARWWAAQIPNSQLTMIPDAGHMLAYTHWDAIVTAFAAMMD